MHSDVDLPSPEHTEQVAHAFIRRVDRYFRLQAPSEQQIEIHVAVESEHAPPDGPTRSFDLAFVLADGTRVPGSLRTRFLGGNMYEVDAAVGDRTKRFTVCLPLRTLSIEDSVNQRICTYLFDEIKRAAGEAYLREITARCGTTEDATS